MDELKATCGEKIGSLARPDDVIFSAELPKTRSGKIHAPPSSRYRGGASAGRYDDAADPTVVVSAEDKYEEQEV